MKVSEFDFDLPPGLIADRPANPRDFARLLVVGDSFDDRIMRDLPGLLRKGDVIVFNDTRVIPAQLAGTGPAGDVRVTLHKEMAPDLWETLANPAKRLGVGDVVRFGADFAATVTARGPGGSATLRFERKDMTMRAALEQFGLMPLPPYIQKLRAPDRRDREDYQTVYAANEGAIAAPTAGLHFTPDLLSAIDRAGIGRLSVTLHVGIGTFLPVRSEETEGHAMHPERGILGPDAAATLNAARAKGGRIVAVGTTATRLLEIATDDTGTIRPFDGQTDLFIAPGYKFRAVDMMLTNFHLPRSTPLMLVSAFARMERIRAAYRHAIAARYRFFSYGDGCLLTRAEGGSP